MTKPVYKSKINLSVGFLSVATLLNTWDIVPPEHQAPFLETVNILGAALIFYFRTFRTGTPLTWSATPITDSGEEANRRD